MTRHLRKVIDTLFGTARQRIATSRLVNLCAWDTLSDVFSMAMLVVNSRRLPMLLTARTVMAGEDERKMHARSRQWAKT